MQLLIDSKKKSNLVGPYGIQIAYKTYKETKQKGCPIMKAIFEL